MPFEEVINVFKNIPEMEIQIKIGVCHCCIARHFNFVNGSNNLEAIEIIRQDL